MTLQLLENCTFTKLGELVKYLSTLDPNLQLIGTDADLGGCDISHQPHVTVTVDNNYIGFGHAEQHIYYMQSNKIDCSDFCEKVYYDYDCRILTGQLKFSHTALDGPTDNPVVLYREFLIYDKDGNVKSHETLKKTFLIESEGWKAISDATWAHVRAELNDFQLQHRLGVIWNKYPGGV